VAGTRNTTRSPNSFRCFSAAAVGTGGAHPVIQIALVLRALLEIPKPPIFSATFPLTKDRATSLRAL
jgi:hypothetical protein